MTVTYLVVSSGCYKPVAYVCDNTNLRTPFTTSSNVCTIYILFVDFMYCYFAFKTTLFLSFKSDVSFNPRGHPGVKYAADVF